MPHGSIPAGRATANHWRPTPRSRDGPGTAASNSPVNRRPMSTPRRYLARWLAGALTLLVLLASPLLAQAPAPDEPSVTLAVTPTEIPVNGTITMSGLGYPQPGVPVNVTVTPPSGTATTLNATPDKNGRYSVTYTRTPVTGSYKVSAQVGAKGVPAHGDFTVRTYLIDIDEDVADNKA